MRLRDVSFSLFLCLCPFVAHSEDLADTVQLRTEESKYEKRMEIRHKRWDRLIPDQAKFQFAGSIGLVSTGVGWTYGRKKQWETDLLIGFLPKYHSKRAKAVLTLKESYVPWLCCISSSSFYVQPLSCSLFLSSVLDESFWVDEPERYPKGFYGFSTRIRANLSLGQRLMYKIPEKARRRVQSLSLYYELSACDTDLCTFFGDRCIKFKDILSLAIGLKVYI